MKFQFKMSTSTVKILGKTLETLLGKYPKLRGNHLRLSLYFFAVLNSTHCPILPHQPPVSGHPLNLTADNNKREEQKGLV